MTIRSYPVQLLSQRWRNRSHAGCVAFTCWVALTRCVAFINRPVWGLRQLVSLRKSSGLPTARDSPAIYQEATTWYLRLPQLPYSICEYESTQRPLGTASSMGAIGFIHESAFQNMDVFCQ